MKLEISIYNSDMQNGSVSSSNIKLNFNFKYSVFRMLIKLAFLALFSQKFDLDSAKMLGFIRTLIISPDRLPLR
jgi:hypothetical protein